MRILVEFLRAEQHWIPDTGSQQNFLIFGFGGLEHRVPCEESDIILAIREAQALGIATSEPAESTFVAEDEQGEDELEQEMLSEEEPVAARPPVLFENPPDDPRLAPQKSSEGLRKELIAKGLEARPRSKTKIVEEKDARRREIARRAPVRTVAMDEFGNPMVPMEHQVTGPAPTVKHITRPQAADDDPFRQG